MITTVSESSKSNQGDKGKKDKGKKTENVFQKQSQSFIQ